MGFKYWINTDPSCGVTVFVKGAQNAQLSFRIFFSRFPRLRKLISPERKQILINKR